MKPGMILKVGQQLLPFFFAFLFFSNNVKSQNVAINSSGTAPNSSAMLDIGSGSGGTSGLLIPRMTQATRTGITTLPAAAQGLVVYQTDGIQGFYYNTSTTTTPSWQYLAPSGSGWSLTGNTGITPYYSASSPNFLGTTDSKSLALETNGVVRMKLDSVGTVWVNESDPSTNTDIFSVTTSTAGDNALAAYNTATTGNAAYIDNTNSTSSADALLVNTQGTGNALEATNNGSGVAFRADNFGDGFSTGEVIQVSGETNNSGSNVGAADIDNTAGVNSALYVIGSTSGATPAADITNISSGDALDINAQASSYAEYIDNTTTTGGDGLDANVTAKSTSSNSALYGYNSNSAYTNYAYGSLGYYDGTSSYYGGYFISSQGSANNHNRLAAPNNMCGIGAYGSDLGAWIKGNQYGLAVSGQKFGLYVQGRTYTNDVITQITSTKSGKQIPAYVNTSMHADVYARGTGQLVDGKAIIQFSKNYQTLIDNNAAVNVTVTPLGSSNGIYLQSINNKGFSVAENNHGTSNVKFEWIAIGTRKGYTQADQDTTALAKNLSTVNKMMDLTSANKFYQKKLAEKQQSETMRKEKEAKWKAKHDAKKSRHVK